MRAGPPGAYHRTMSRIPPLLAAVAFVAVTAVGASSATPHQITERSAGKTFRLAKGDTATLRLSSRWQWSDPRVSTKVVELTPVEYFTDPGFREWTIDARRRGRATIRATGRPTCPACTTRSFRVVIVVR